MKKRAFTFVELLLVMLILGIIISLTLPIIKNIKDDDDIFRAYMKKANQDVTDAMGMIFVKEPNFRGFEMFEAVAGTYDADIVGQFSAAGALAGADADMIKSIRMKNAFNRGLNTFECGVCTDVNDSATCISIVNGGNRVAANCTNNQFVDVNNRAVPLVQPGLVIGGKPVLVFQYSHQPANVAAGRPEDIYGYVYIDMNKDKSPNELCKDRYRFVVYNDRVAMDGCSFEL